MKLHFLNLCPLFYKYIAVTPILNCSDREASVHFCAILREYVNQPRKIFRHNNDIGVQGGFGDPMQKIEWGDNQRSGQAHLGINLNIIPRTRWYALTKPKCIWEKKLSEK